MSQIISKTCLLFLVLNLIVLTANANVVSFIDACHVNDDPCALASAKKAMPFLIEGIPEYGITSADPLVVGNADGGSPSLNLGFTDMTVTGLSKCILKRVRRPESLKVYVEAECPIKASGNYKMNGDMGGIPVHGAGPCNIGIGKFWWEVNATLKKIKGKDGEHYYKVTKFDYNFEPVSDIKIKLDNMYEGDADQESKAKAMESILNEGGKEVIKSLGKDIISKLFEKEIGNIATLIAKIPAKEMELD